MEDKIKFYQQQHENAKKDLKDQQAKFEQTLESVQRKGSIEKDKQEISVQLFKETMEKHNQTLEEQIRELREKTD